MELQRSRPGYISPRDLSRVPPFALGPLAVEPATRSLAAGDRRVTLEPRVMQVLVALGLDPGQVLSRDDLIALCWDGVIVGDNAINRVVSLLRQALAEVAGNAVRLETITKVGFRIVVETSEEPPAAPTGRVARRGALGKLAALAAVPMAAGGGWLVYRDFASARPDPRAAELVERARLLQLTGEPGTSEQAIAFLKQAVAADPGYADAWGALSLAYLLALAGFTGRDTATMVEQMTAAARECLALDPRQRDAAAVLAFARPAFGDFARFDEATAAILSRYPDYWYAHARRAMFLRDVGRMQDALPHAARSIVLDPMLPIGWGNVSLGYFLAGDFRRADATLDGAAERWPAHGYLWTMRLQLLLESKRFDQAVSVALDPSARPDYVPGEVGEQQARLARSLRDDDRPALRRTRDELLAQIGRVAITAQSHAPVLAMMGYPGEAVEGLARLYGLARRSPALAHQVATVVLFRPSLRALRAEPGYRSLLELSGLTRYWRQSGSQPDFRRS